MFMGLDIIAVIEPTAPSEGFECQYPTQGSN